MRKTQLVLSLLIALLLGSALCAADIQITNTDGTPVTISKVADRVVCLNGDAAEMMIALGAGDRVVGLTSEAMNNTVLKPHLPYATDIGNWQKPNVEQVLNLRPDTVIAYSSSKPKNTEQFENAGIKLIYLDCYKIDSMKHDALAMGTILGKENAAKKYLSWMTKWTDLTLFNTTGIYSDNVPDVYLEGYSDYSAQGKDSGGDQMINKVKGKNIAYSLEGTWPKVTPEWVIKEDPDFIIKEAGPTEGKTTGSILNSVTGREGFGNLTAVKNNKVYVLDGKLILGPRSPAGLVYLAKILHPDETKDLNPSDALAEYDQQFVSGTKTGDYLTPAL